MVSLVLFVGATAFGLDSSKYISVDEIKRGMEGYCLTVLAGTEPKKYPIKVVSVVYNQKPGRDAILVMGTDEAFKHIGATQGCSGSPVYIDGRMAGALSAGWTFAVDPLYSVTPIEDMLRVGSLADSASATATAASSDKTGIVDFSKPIDLSVASENVFSLRQNSKSTAGQFNALPCPLVTSFPGEVCRLLGDKFNKIGLMPLAGGSADTSGNADDTTKYVPGGVLSVPLVSGDIAMAAVGTVTEVVGDKVYGFGHSFLGHGAVDLPMAAGMVHTVVSNMNISFKLASAGKIKGAFRADESTAIFGKTGEKARLIDMRIKINRFDSSKEKTYNCKIAYDRLYTPALLQASLSGAALMQGSLPPEHVVRYKGIIGIKGCEPIILDDISSGRSVMDVASEATGLVSLLMNNPFGEAEIESFDFDIDIKPDNILASVSSVQLDDTKVKAGGKIAATIVLQSYLSEKRVYQLDLDIPRDLKPGKHKIAIAGSADYERLIRKIEPHKFFARDLDSLIKALRYVVSFRRDKLYMLLQLPADGVTIEGVELDRLPASKAMLLKSKTRTLTTMPLGQWIQESKTIPSIVNGGATMEIIVQ